MPSAFKLFQFLFAGLFLTALPSAAQKVAPPNIILITADNLGYGDLGSYGNKAVKTPHLDRLASQGMRFTDFYSASPTCAVSRGSYLTGRYPRRTGLTRQPIGEENFGIVLPKREKILPAYLKEAGYATGCFGKWNIGFAKGTRPTERGCDEFLGSASGNIDYYSYSYKGNHDLFRGTEAYHPNGYPYSTYLFADAARDFIRRKAAEPFFLYLPFNAPHYPAPANKKPGEKPVWQAPAEAFEAYGLAIDEDEPQNRYWAVLTALDTAIGRVLADLDSLGIADRTLVVFFSDNGAFMMKNKGLEVASSGPLHPGRADLYEGGIRVPAIVRWPNRIRAGSISVEPLSAMDIFVLALKAAGRDVPRDRVIDGRDPIPTLLEGKPSPHERMFWMYRDMRAVRQGRYKLLDPGDGSPARLFDLAYDVGETTDLSTSMAAKAAELQRALDEWTASL